ncbi:hypothetical protein ACFE04_018613 [Oxalis oulophora]
MSSALSLQFLKALPYLRPPPRHKTTTVFHITCKLKPPSNIKHNDDKKVTSTITQKANEWFGVSKSSLAVQIGALLAIIEQPALAVTGANNHELDLVWVLTQSAICGFVYFLLMPPIIMNWARLRWYKRNLLEMYFQFMFIFIFFPGILLWAPFVNFRKLPRDPSMKYPWSEPEDRSKIKGGFRKFPWAKLEDYSEEYL